MSHKAILQAVKQKKSLKNKSSSLPSIQSNDQPRLSSVQRCKSAEWTTQKRNVYMVGCDSTCECCRDFPLEHSIIRSSPIRKDQNFLMSKHVCHSRLNHRTQYTGVYRRRFKKDVEDTLYIPEFTSVRCDIEAPKDANDFRSCQKWTCDLRNSRKKRSYGDNKKKIFVYKPGTNLDFVKTIDYDGESSLKPKRVTPSIPTLEISSNFQKSNNWLHRKCQPQCNHDDYSLPRPFF